MPYPSHPPWFDHPNTWQKVQIMALLITCTTYPAHNSCYIIYAVDEASLNNTKSASHLCTVMVSLWLMQMKMYHEIAMCIKLILQNEVKSTISMIYPHYVKWWLHFQLCLTPWWWIINMITFI
jgi:hypothetical protein